MKNEELDFRIFADTDKFEHIIDLNGKPLTECIEEYIKYKERSVSKGTVAKYRMMLRNIRDIQEKNDMTVYPIVVGTMFMGRFSEFLSSRGMSQNTICSMCSSLKSVLKWASVFGAKVSDEAQTFKTRPQDSRPKVTLSQEEISRIYWFDIDSLHVRKDKKAMFKKVRDQFVLSCFLGQRFSDARRIEPSNFVGIKKDTFRITQQKTGNRAVVQFDKLYDEYPYLAHRILNEYGFRAPYSGDISNYNKRLHEFLKYVGIDDEIHFECKVNGVIVDKTYKKYELISSHCSRRTFITNAVKRGVHTQQIKRASGHTTDKSFGKYVIFQEDV